MHVWSGGQITRAFIRACLEYLFVENKKELAIGLTPCDNAEALDFNARIGFRVISKIPDAWQPGTSVVIQTLRHDECIWLKRGIREQEYSSAA
jgi:hypothetical protein